MDRSYFYFAKFIGYSFRLHGWFGTTSYRTTERFFGIIYPKGKYFYAIAVHAPSARLTLERAMAKLPALQAAAEKMTALL